MKNIVFILASLLFLMSCQSSHEENNQQTMNSTKTENISSEWILNDLLKYKDANALKEKFGEKNVVTDTIWGPEGEFEIGTTLFPGTINEVRIKWHDAEKQANMSSASIYVGYYDKIDKYDFGSQWKTKEGVYLGMPLEELIKLNGKPIKFYGFGWDYSGLVQSFENGSLQDKMRISLIYTSNISEKDYLEIIGDKIISTENINLSKYKFVVASLEVLFRSNSNE